MKMSDAQEDEAQPKGRETLASSIYDTLRQDILTLALPADEKLNIRALADRFGVGPSPIREALSRLSTERLVTQSDHRGFKVAAVSVADLRDLCRARIAIDGLALRKSIEIGAVAWEEQLVLAFHRLSRTPRFAGSDTSVRNPQWEEMHRLYHAALTAGSDSAWLATVCAQLFEASERYRHVARLAGKSGPREEEHRQITDAALSRKADLAVELLAAHYEKTAELAEIALNRKP